MKNARFAIAAAAFLGALQATPASAQRVFVAAQGSDTNPCTFAQPCRTFQRAHNTVAAGGEIDVLDPAGYGSVTITKSISIQGHGFAGISVAASAAGIDVNAGASDVVSLKGLLIEGSGVGLTGIRFRRGKLLTIANCVVRGVVNGINAGAPNVSTLQALSVSNSYFTDSGNGILISPIGSGTMTATIARVAFLANQVGLDISNDGSGLVEVAAADIVASGNGNGIAALDHTLAHVGTSLVLTRATVSGNGVGVAVTGLNSIVRIGQSTLTGNTAGFSISDGLILSYGDNVIANNGSNTGTLGSATRR
jgi:hypothetical protein